MTGERESSAMEEKTETSHLMLKQITGDNNRTKHF